MASKYAYDPIDEEVESSNASFHSNFESCSDEETDFDSKIHNFSKIGEPALNVRASEMSVEKLNELLIKTSQYDNFNLILTERTTECYRILQEIEDDSSIYSSLTSDSCENIKAALEEVLEEQQLLEEELRDLINHKALRGKAIGSDILDTIKNIKSQIAAFKQESSKTASKIPIPRSRITKLETPKQNAKSKQKKS